VSGAISINPDERRRAGRIVTWHQERAARWFGIACLHREAGHVDAYASAQANAETHYSEARKFRAFCRPEPMVDALRLRIWGKRA
jgi:hypothetical protein